ncbi:MAG: TGS domain-containing protein [Candidatus Aenigmatarchaeota archaeon]|nr:DUF933 domain-containing protein [Candidatus Aenigmarchaeota archaeon]
MPANVTAEFAKAQSKYLSARTREEKIAALEEMLATIPKHKGTEHMQAEIRGKLAKLRGQKSSKVARTTITISKEGDAQIVILGPTQTGKSTLLAQLTNAKPKISDVPYTTTKPEVGVSEWKGVKFQLIEIPSTFTPSMMSITANADGIVVVLDPRRNLDEQRDEIRKLFSKFRIQKPHIEIIGRTEIDAEYLKSSIWKMLGLIRIYTKEPGKKPETKALVLKAGATVKDAASAIHKDFLKFFKFAKVWGSAKYAGERVGLDYKLKDGDILEIHAG